MRNRSSIILLLFLLTYWLNAQEFKVNKENADSSTLYEPAFDKQEMLRYLQNKKLHLNLEVGTMFGTTFGNGNYFATYVAPQINYQLTPRFNLKMGIQLVNNFGGNFAEGTSYNHPWGYPMYYPTSMVYLGGDYKLNEKLTLSGTAYKQVNLFNFENQPGYSNDLKGVIMGVDYKIGENTWIRGQVEFSNGYRNSGAFPGMNLFPQNHFNSGFYPDNPF